MPVSTPQEVFDAMPGKFKGEKANGLSATVLFDLSGDNGGQWVATIVQDRLTVEKGTIPNPTLTFTAKASDYVALINGQLKPMPAFMQGKIKIKGDMTLAMKVQALFG